MLRVENTKKEEYVWEYSRGLTRLSGRFIGSYKGALRTLDRIKNAYDSLIKNGLVLYNKNHKLKLILEEKGDNSVIYYGRWEYHCKSLKGDLHKYEQIVCNLEILDDFVDNVNGQ